jgi:hypothetical protein
MRLNNRDIAFFEKITGSNMNKDMRGFEAQAKILSAEY